MVPSPQMADLCNSSSHRPPQIRALYLTSLSFDVCAGWIVLGHWCWGLGWQWAVVGSEGVCLILEPYAVLCSPQRSMELLGELTPIDWSRNYPTSSEMRIKPYRCTYEGCTAAYYYNSHLRAHQNQKHGRLPRWRRSNPSFDTLPSPSPVSSIHPPEPPLSSASCDSNPPPSPSSAICSNQPILSPSSPPSLQMLDSEEG